MSEARAPFGGFDDACVVSALGVVTSGAIGRQALWSLLEKGERPRELGLRDFKAAARFVDRKFLRATSNCDAFALTSIATMLESRGCSPTCYDAERVGLYVGASPASAQENSTYVEAMLASRGATQRSSVREFGRTCMAARPTTLLVGLPNNVLCYGAMMLEARGPNSNYTVPWLGGFLAILNAWRRLRRHSIDLAVAGAYAAYASDLGRELYRQLASAHDLADFSQSIADGAAFLALERRSALGETTSSGHTVLLGGGMASDGLGPFRHDPQGVVFERLIRRVLAEAGLEPCDVALVLAGQGLGQLDALERTVLTRVFAAASAPPAAASLYPVLGNLMEARGVVDLGLIKDFFVARNIPGALQVRDWPSRIDDMRRAALIVQVSPWGEYGCLVARYET